MLNPFSRKSHGERFFRGCVAAGAAFVVMVGAAGLARAQSQLPLTTGPGAFPPPSMRNQMQNSTASAPASPQSHSAVPQAGGQVAPSDYRLGSGDHVHITVFGQEDLTGDYQVDGSGKLAFPLIGDVQAGGLTARELEREIRSALSPQYLRDPKVSAEVLAYRPFYILGEVRTPGSYSYVSGMTVLNAVALAGGFTPRAKKEDFRLERLGKDGHRSNLDASEDTAVEPGDVITVRERWF